MRYQRSHPRRRTRTYTKKGAMHSKTHTPDDPRLSADLQRAHRAVSLNISRAQSAAQHSVNVLITGSTTPAHRTPTINPQQSIALFYPADCALLSPTGLPISMKAKLPTSFVFESRKPLDYLRTRPDARLVGLLNEANPKKACGSFLTGANGPEEHLAMQTTLLSSLQSIDAQPFYMQNKVDDRDGLYSHGMIYSPVVQIIRDRKDALIVNPPFQTISVATSAPINTTIFRSRRNLDSAQADPLIRQELKERIGRILRLFEEQGRRILVLPPFGIGIGSGLGFAGLETIASIFAEWLHWPNAKFSQVFDEVIFTLGNPKNKETFENAFLASTIEGELLSMDVNES